jgi:hypothetical protein
MKSKFAIYAVFVLFNYTFFGKNSNGEFPAKDIRAHLTYFSLSLRAFRISRSFLGELCAFCGCFVF